MLSGGINIAKMIQSIFSLKDADRFKSTNISYLIHANSDGKRISEEVLLYRKDSEITQRH